MRLPSLLAAGALAIALLTLPATAPADVIGAVGGYAKDRVHDFLDIFRLRAGYPRDGKAIGVKARATSLVQVGYVSFDGTYAGLDRRGIGLVDERRREAGVSVLYGSFNEMEPRAGNGFLRADTPWSFLRDRRILRNLPHWDDGRRRHLSFGAEVATPLIAFDVGVYPEEALDFVLGFLVIDIFRDDELLLKPHDWEMGADRPVPDDAAPFADRRDRFERHMNEIEEREAEELRQLIEELSRRPDQPTEQQSHTPAEAAPRAATQTGEITTRDADEAIRELEQMEDLEDAPAPDVQDSAPEDAEAEEAP